MRGRRAAARAATMPAVDLSFRTIERSSGARSGLSAQRTIAIRTTRRWKQAWRQLHRGSTKKAPKVNFARYTLLLATQGQRPNGGYGIAIERVVLDGGEVTLHVVDTEPDPAATQCAYPQMIVNPYHVVRVRRTDRPIGPVNRRTQLVSC